MKLTPRLKSIAEMVSYKTFADIGTDHCKLPIFLIQNNKVSSAIACDIKNGPIEACKKNVRNFSLESTIEVRMGDGFKPLTPYEVETVVVAGMGGELIVKILEDSKSVAKSFKELIFQPMTAVYELRKYLYENDFTIVDEVLVTEDEKLYTIIKAIPERSNLKDDFYYVISDLLIKKNDKHLSKLIEREINKATKKLQGALNAKIINQLEIQKLQNLLSSLGELL